MGTPGSAPEPIVETLALHADIFIAAPRAGRVVRTEELYRRLNHAIATVLDVGAPTDIETVVHGDYAVVRKTVSGTH